MAANSLTLNIGTQVPIGLLHNQADKQAFPIKVVSKSTKKSPEPGEVCLIVGCISFSAGDQSGNVSARLELWVNPPIGEKEPGGPADADLGLSDAKLRGFWMSSKGTNAGVTTFDEIRLGTSFSDVVPSAP